MRVTEFANRFHQVRPEHVVAAVTRPTHRHVAHAAAIPGPHLGARRCRASDELQPVPHLRPGYRVEGLSPELFCAVHSPTGADSAMTSNSPAAARRRVATVRSVAF